MHMHIMPLVMFMDAIEHVSRISRVIRQPQGNALLLGVGGSGRQSVTKLATSMAEFEMYRVEIAKGYSRTDWLDNLRELPRDLPSSLTPHCSSFLLLTLSLRLSA